MENLSLIGALYVLLLFILLASGMWIAMALGAVGIFGLYFVSGGGLIKMVGELQFNSTNSFIFTMIPLFVAMGEFFKHSELSSDVYESASKWVKFLPGGLLHANILACALFSAVSGASMATAATIATVAVPECEKRGYPLKILFGSLAAGGTLGILIPPSLSLIIYGAFVGESIGRLFIGGIMPGVVMSLFFMLYIALYALSKPHLFPQRDRFSPRDMYHGFKKVWPLILLIFIVLGTVYLGVASPTEAAALGASSTFLMAIAYKRMNWNILSASLHSALETCCFLMFIIISAYIFSMALSMQQIPMAITSFISHLNIGKYQVWVLLIGIYFVLGCFIDGASMMLLTLPVVFPLMTSLGFDSIWLGVALTILIEIGQITPPVGVNLFVMDGITGRTHLKEIVIGAVPFFLIQILVLLLITAIPEVVTWLPNLMISSF